MKNVFIDWSQYNKDLESSLQKAKKRIVELEKRILELEKQCEMLDECGSHNDIVNFDIIAKQQKRIAELEKELADANECLTIAYMEGFSDGKSKGGE